MKPIDSLVKLHCLFFPPDNRKRDLGNLDKCLLDALTKAGVWTDDSLVDDQRFRRARNEDGSLHVVNDGLVIVEIDLFYYCYNGLPRPKMPRSICDPDFIINDNDDN